MPDTDRIVSPDEIQGAPRRTGRLWFDFLAARAALFTMEDADAEP